jgi:hypothetical protein
LVGSVANGALRLGTQSGVAPRAVQSKVTIVLVVLAEVSLG